MTQITPPFKDEDLLGDGVSKKDLVTFLQESGSSEFLVQQKLAGAAKNVIKTKTKEQLVESYKELFEKKAFKSATDKGPAAASQDVDKITEKTKTMTVKAEEPVKYTKRVTKQGDKTNFPKKGDDVACFYTGRLQNGKVFDTNTEETRKGRKALPLRFKVGVGKVIRGWDEALLTMSTGEKAEITIQPEWAYGKKGVEGKIPPSSVLIFDVELVSIE